MKFKSIDFINKILELQKSNNSQIFFEANFSEHFQKNTSFDQVLPILEAIKSEKFEVDRLLTNHTVLLLSPTWRVSLGFDNDSKINYFYVIENKPKSELVYTQNSYSLPFESEWFTFWGGEYLDLNYHNVPNQYFAYDFFIFDENLKSSLDSINKESFYAYNKPILSVAEGEVISVVNKFEDNIDGIYEIGSPAGNCIVIKHENLEYSFYAHLKKDSMKVKMGDRVKQGQQIASCGNSGNSSEPHLHFQIMDSSDFQKCKTKIVKFKNIKVRELSEENSKLISSYSPVKGEFICKV